MTTENGSSEGLKGQYANYFKVGYNAFEFVLDFGQYFQQNGKDQFHTRIVMGPVYAKALLDTLRASIGTYEQSFGVIPDQDE